MLVIAQDVIVHVRDISHPDTHTQKKVVLETLHSLHLPEQLLNSIIEVCNKVDCIDKLVICVFWADSFIQMCFIK